MALRELHKILIFGENSGVTSPSPEEAASILSGFKFLKNGLYLQLGILLVVCVLTTYSLWCIL